MIFLNEQGLNEIFDEVYFDLGQVPISTIKFSDDFQKKFDGFHFIEKPNLHEFLIEPFKKLQPKSYNHLINGRFFYAIQRDPFDSDEDITQFGIFLNGRAFYISHSPNSYSETPNYFKFLNMPDFILKSWFCRNEKWSVAEDKVIGIYKSRLPSTLKKSIKSIINNFNSKTNLDKHADFLTTKFNHEYKRSDDTTDMTKHFDLELLLDTRDTDEFSEKNGYQLFLSTQNDKEIYIIKDANVFSIKKLDNAQDAIDSYGAHLFSGAEGEFDFSQYAVDF